MATEMTEKQSFPQNWLVNGDFEPQKHLIQIKGRDYMNVQNRLMWFIRDQRSLIAAGLARMSYIIQTDIVEIDRQNGWAHFKTYIRDVLGNEATMYGSESARDFADYVEKASTKSLGRTLLLLGYGTPFAIELDEGERVVDAPQEHSSPNRYAQSISPSPYQPAQKSQSRPVGATTQPPNGAEAMATDRQLTSIRKLCSALNQTEPDLASLTFNAARELLTQLSHAYSESRQAS
jgi:hypothetical protein